MTVSSENVTPPDTGEKEEEIYRATFCARPVICARPGRFTTADSFEIPADCAIFGARPVSQQSAVVKFPGRAQNTGRAQKIAR